MKETKENAVRLNLLELGTQRRRDSRMSTSSRRSVRSNHSDESNRSRSRRRPRGLSFSSTHSRAVSEGSQDSGTSNALSRKTSHADDSAASDSDSSLGETDEDVWFPNNAADHNDIDVAELDQLLNLSDDETSESAVAQNTTHTPAGVVSIERSKKDTNPSSNVGQQTKPQPVRNADLRCSQMTGTSSAEPRASQEVQRHLPNSRAPGAIQENDADHGTNYGQNSNSPHLTHGYSNGDDFGDSLSDDPEKQHVNEEERIAMLKRGGMNRKSSFAGSISAGVGEVANADEQSQRFSFYAPTLDNTIHAPDLRSLVGESDSFRSLFNPSNGAWFLDCFRPTDIEMKALSRAFGIHPLTTEDILTQDKREKFDLFKNYYLVVYHTFESDKEDPNYMEAIHFYTLVFKEGVITFHFEPVSHCRNVRRRMRQLRDYISFSPDWIAYALIDDITDYFAPEMEVLDKEVDFVEEAVYLDRERQVPMSVLLRRLGEARRVTMRLLRMLNGKAEVVRAFAKRSNESHMPGTEMGLYLGDIQDHIVTMHQNLISYEQIFSRCHFNYMGLLQMEFVDSSNDLTAVLGKVTILGTILLPMNLITGLFGMNVKVPGQGVENLRWFFSILGLILFLVLVLFVGGHFYVRFIIKKHQLHVK